MPREAKAIYRRGDQDMAPPWPIEYAYYAFIFYSIAGTALGLSAPLLGGGILAVLAAFCALRLGSRAIIVYKPILLLFVFAISFLVVQITIHGASITDGIIRVFTTWVLGLIIVQSLCLRQGFLHRFMIVLLLIGLTTLPYLEIGAGDRVIVEPTLAGDFNNPNGLGAWFGFCAVYLAIFGIETKRNAVRIASWLVACGCLLIVGLTVSRGALIATVTAIVVASRHLLKRGFLPILVLIVLSWVCYESGIFDRAVSRYTGRMTEDSGRASVWPLAVERALSSPLVGVGNSNIATYVPWQHQSITPHNTFIYLLLSSGVIPIAFFVTFWIRAARNAFLYTEQQAYSSFRGPFLVYIFWITLVGDLGFMVTWGLVVFPIVMTSRPSSLKKSFVVRQIKKFRTVRHFEPRVARPHIPS